ncbi:hypothetical protein WJX73_006827 [Symbiochloris irregularis]|uniref:MutL C-terminal dimerisation domain-containing protein n=1 Tax=Symbiochloris irregularis TaxID=706552 RepID=A0AAW1PVK4_9CHLO
MAAHDLQRLPAAVSSKIDATSNVSGLAVAIQQCALNSVEAEARSVEIEVDFLQLTAIVVDNGRGIAESDIQLLANPRCTAKSSAQQHQVQQSRTLASIAGMCVLEIASRARGSFETHNKIIRGGFCLNCGLALHQRDRPGTVVTIRDFLYNLPVRRKQLHNNGERQELTLLSRLILKLALQWPSVSFRLMDKTTGQQLLKFSKDKPSETLMQAFGQAAESMPLVAVSDPCAEVALRITTMPQGHRSRDAQHAYVNGRPLASFDPINRHLDGIWKAASCVQAWRSILPSSMLPAPPGGLISTGQTMPASKGGPSRAVQAGQGQERAAGNVAVRKRKRRAPAPAGPMLACMPGWRLTSRKLCANQTSHRDRQEPTKAGAGVQRPHQGLSHAQDESGAPLDDAAPHADPLAEDAEVDLTGARDASADDELDHGDAPAFVGDEGLMLKRRQDMSQLQRALLDWHNPCWAPPTNAAANVPDLDAIGGATCPTLVPEVLTRQQLQQGRALAQIDAKFIAIVTGGVLTIVDQHAADERVKLEQLRHEVLDEQRMPRKPVSILLVPAERLDLDFQQLATLEAHAAKVSGWGWRWQRAPASTAVQSDSSRGGTPHLVLTHVPVLLGRSLGAANLQAFLVHLAGTNGAAGLPPAATVLLNSRACRSALMFNTQLAPSEADSLLTQLKQTRLCFACAHGRPTLDGGHAGTRQHAEIVQKPVVMSFSDRTTLPCGHLSLDPRIEETSVLLIDVYPKDHFLREDGWAGSEISVAIGDGPNVSMKCRPYNFIHPADRPNFSTPQLKELSNMLWNAAVSWMITSKVGASLQPNSYTLIEWNSPTALKLLNKQMKMEQGGQIWIQTCMPQQYSSPQYNHPPKMDPFWKMELPRSSADNLFVMFRLRPNPQDCQKAMRRQHKTNCDLYKAAKAANTAAREAVAAANSAPA